MVERIEVSDQDLSDLLDGRLDPERAAEVRAALGQHPALAHRYAVLLEQDRLLARLGEDILKEPVPDELSAILRGARAIHDAEAVPAAPEVAPAPMPTLRWTGLVPALVAAAGVGLILGWFGQTYFGPSETGLFRAAVEQAALAHRMYEASDQQPGENLAESDVLPVAELPNLFGTPVRAPSLKDTGWVPVALKTESGSGGNAMQIAYADAEGDHVTLFVRRLAEVDDVPANLVEAEGYDVLYWLDGPLVYALVGDQDRKTLTGLARQIYASRAVGGAWTSDVSPDVAPAAAPAAEVPPSR